MKRLLIIGASARAAAFSALRTGLEPCCMDLFADADLRACAATRRIPADRYPHGFLNLIPGAEPAPWLYTGALENYPSLVERIALNRLLWGNNAGVLRRIRSPFRVAAVLARHGLRCPVVWRHVEEIPAGHCALIKPLRGAGGAGISFWADAPTRPSRGSLSSSPPRAAYFQEYVEGEACAAVYVADRRDSRLLGVTRQLVGEPWLHAQPFHYCGSIGPLHLEPDSRQAFEQLGAVLTRSFGLRGLFGVDCVLRAGVLWPVEVNPRYAASVEVLEHALGVPALHFHRQAFDAAGTVTTPHSPLTHSPLTTHQAPGTAYVAKAILFARRPLLFPADGPWLPTLQKLGTKHVDPWELPAFADIPQPGERIAVRRPVLTLFASSPSWKDCYRSLQDIARDLDRWLFRR
jgi:uncharacterized protein